MKIYLINIIIITLFANCNSVDSEHLIRYDFENPTEDIRLEKKLNEISGLSFVDSNSIASINDEKGKIYLIDLISFAQNKIIEFKDNGDFEGIQKVGENYYVLESNGNLYEVKPNGNFEKYDLFEKGFEFEGLCISPHNGSLLLACKRHNVKKKDDHVWIYEFDLISKKIKKETYLKLDKKKVKKTFRPSGLSFHPNGNLFIISGVSNSLIELSPKFEIVNQVQLPEFKYPQVEGICFDSDGGMYLSSERDYLEKGKLYYLKQL